MTHVPLAYRYQNSDGVRATMLLLEGVVHDFTFAARLRGRPDPFSIHFFTPPQNSRISGLHTRGSFFNPMIQAIEKMFLTKRAPYPVERTLLTTGLTAAGVESIWKGQKRLETPHLKIAYQPSRESTFWRN